MNLTEFLRETQAAVRSQMREGALYEELVFSGIVMDHMSEIGMTFEPVECHFEGKVGNANLRLSGYSLSEENDQLDLFVSLYANVDVPTPVPDAETKTAVEQCLRFLSLCAEGKMARGAVTGAAAEDARLKSSLSMRAITERTSARSASRSQMGVEVSAAAAFEPV